MPLHLVTGASAVGVLAALWYRRYPLARVLAAAQVTFDARARQSYFVRVAASPATVPGGDVGAYSLSVTPDDAGSGITQRGRG